MRAIKEVGAASAQELGESPDVGHVRGHRVNGQVSLQAEVILEPAEGGLVGWPG